MSKFMKYLKETKEDEFANLKNASNEEVLDIWVDIVSSGQGVGFTNWHKKELSKCIAAITQEQKDYVWKKMYSVNNVINDEIDEEEVDWITDGKKLGHTYTDAEKAKLRDWFDGGDDDED